MRGGELATLMPIIDRVVPRLDAPKLLLFDGLARGTHIERVMRDLGLITVAPINARSSDRRGRQARAEREVPFGHVTATDSTGRPHALELWTYAGQISTREFDEQGTPLYLPLALRRVIRRGRPGVFRFYADYETPEGWSLTLPLLPTEDDRQRKFNRCEHFRVFPPASEQYRLVYGRRSDTESSHRQLKDALWQRRANVYGSHRVLGDALGWAIGHNALARYIRKRQPERRQLGAA